MPKTSRVSKDNFVQDVSPELFKIEKKRLEEKPAEVKQGSRDLGMGDKVDIWEQELKAWQEEAAALKTHSNESVEPGLAQRSASQYESSDHQPIRAVNPGLAVALKVKRKAPGAAA